MGIATAGRRIALLAAVCATAGFAFTATKPPARAPHLSHGCERGHGIALTFDDGPNPPFTYAILDVLRERGVKATFFIEGEAAEAHPNVVREVRDAGMAIGAHSYSHSTDLATMGADGFGADLEHVERVLRETLGFAPALDRSPYGHTSDTMLEVEGEHGFTSVGWDLDSTDWSDSSVDKIVSAVVNGAHPGAIVLMHDGGLGGGNPDRTKTIAALPRIIDGLRARGYEFETVPELTGAAARQGDTAGAACSTR